MQEMVDEAGNVWLVDAQGNPVRLIEQAPQGMPADPTFPFQGDRAEAEARQAQNQADASELAREAEAARIRASNASAAASAANAQGSQIQNAEDRAALSRLQRSQAQKELNSAFQTSIVLDSIREARKIAQEDGGTGWESLMSGVPSTDALRLATALNPIRANLGFDRLQQMRDESPTGGAVGNLSEGELKALSDTVADVEQALDLPTFLKRLDMVERKFIGAQLTAMGVDPKSPEGRELFKRDYGYSGVFEGETPSEALALKDPNSDTAANILPDEYQAAHLRYLRENWGNITPEGYSNFRAGLDEQYGFTSDLRAYAAAVPSFNQAAQQGLEPSQLGAVPSPERDMGVIEQGFNRAVQSAPSAALANFGNAAALGLPGYLSGNNVPMELLREKRPVSSFLGEMAGGTASAVGAGGLAGRAGANLLAKPFVAEGATSAAYGFTQDDNPLRGAAMGVAGSLVGSAAGQGIGRLFPNEIAQKTLDDVYAGSPTVPDLKREAANLYAGVRAKGNTATPEQTESIYESALKTLAERGRVGGDGRVIVQDGSTKQAVDLLDSFSGLPMLPQQAQTVRETLGEGLASPIDADRAIAANLLDDFDGATAEIMPGAADARAVSKRYIQGQNLQRERAMAEAVGLRQKGNDVGDATRTAFGQIDKKIVGDQVLGFSDQTKEAIANVARGDAITNALRTAGKFNLSNPVSLGAASGGVGGAAYALGGDPLTSVGVGLGAAGLGSVARGLAEKRTMNAAKLAEMSALMPQIDYEAALKRISEIARQRSGRVGGGLFGTGAPISTRSREPLPQR